MKMKIKGEIVQIISPEEHDSYIFGKQQHEMVEGWYIVVIEKTHSPKGFFKRLFSKGDPTWDVLMRECPYKVGEIVEIEVHEYFARTRWLCTEEFGKQHTCTINIS